MTSKEIINKAIKEKKEMLEKAKKNKFEILAKQCEQDIEDYNKVLKDLEEKEKQDLLLKNIRRNNCKSVTPLSDIFQGLKQEERYKYIEHIYYSYKELEEQKELLESELKLEKDKVKYVMGQLEKQDRILNALLKNADYQYDECYGIRGHQCIMIGIIDKDECFDEIREMVENYEKSK